MSDMKGIVLAAGRGARLQPMTKYVSKLLLPVYDRPMIEEPLSVLHRLGIKTTMIVLDQQHSEQVKNYLGDNYHEMSLSYGIQDQPLGSADALKVARKYAGDNDVAVIMGDQYMTNLPVISRFKQGSICYFQEVLDVSRYGSIKMNEHNLVTSISEKPPGREPGNALVGFYLFDKQIWEHLDNVGLSARGEYELTDALRQYARKEQLDARKLRGYWTDAGTPESLYVATSLARQKKIDITNEVAGRYI